MGMALPMAIEGGGVSGRTHSGGEGEEEEEGGGERHSFRRKRIMRKM